MNITNTRETAITAATLWLCNVSFARRISLEIIRDVYAYESIVYYKEIL